MDLDDDICHCYHVPMRKLVNFARRTRPVRPSQLSECLGAGTGCGWCIPILRKIFEVCREELPSSSTIVDMTPQEYAEARKAYRQAGGDKHQF